MNFNDRIYSRLYGYSYQNKKVTIVDSEAEIIRFVFDSLIEHQNIAIVKVQLVAHQYRNRSNKQFSIAEIKNIIRPIYAGLTVGFLGFYLVSKHYPPIVPLKTYKKALKTLKLMDKAPPIRVPKAS